jgi:hypothetical protein
MQETERLDRLGRELVDVVDMLAGRVFLDYPALEFLPDAVALSCVTVFACMIEARLSRQQMVARFSGRKMRTGVAGMSMYWLSGFEHGDYAGD